MITATGNSVGISFSCSSIVNTDTPASELFAPSENASCVPAQSDRQFIPADVLPDRFSDIALVKQYPKKGHIDPVRIFNWDKLPHPSQSERHDLMLFEPAQEMTTITEAREHKLRQAIGKCCIRVMQLPE